ncbi:peptidyl-prolyl cis-trans isomerase, EpsD family [Chitinibacter fontanus]|uniref:Peptidyl-prolyl cis-trans isomerase, EpsD family n=1 Tax=Chitinibacter fontanus TaxID=1737446 RepID=A0A7D5ZG94_9NEIS|nr:EpsD family peptidyl-prolyl cis-trans isomerase [Chitinibacter fontanus]QLI82544.1 peptidyl-prolyl cis-trans isomerase, EpsD family [Chitinibacter fontanus]
MKLKPLILSVLIASALTACGDKEEKKSPSQVLAKVNDSEITVHQLNFVLGQIPNAQPEQKQQVLDQLVDQELLVQKAAELKLDREPNVLQAIENAKRQILAQAAAERVIGKPADPAKTAVDEFYAKNPALFAERKNYEFITFVIEKSAYNDALANALNTATTPALVKSALDGAQIKYSTSDAARTAEQLPMPMLPKFAAMNIGDIMALQEGDKMILLQLKATQPATISPHDAEPLIKRYLSNNEAQTQAQAKMKALREAAKVEYLQRFASEVAVAKPAPQAGSATDESLKAGLKGLK